MFHKIIFFLACFVLQVRGQYEGERCSAGGAVGVCKIITLCPSAIEDIRNRKIPKICGFVNVDPVVCCVEPAAAATEAPVSSYMTPSVSHKPLNTTTGEYIPDYYDYVEEAEATCPPIDPGLTAPKTGQKAWDKCVEYQEQLVYPCKRSVALTGGRVRGNHCRHSASKLIINGVDAAEAEFPHMALLGFQDGDDISFACGGSVLSDRFILTAGHCTYAGRLGPVKYALLGTLRRSDDYERDNLYEVARIIKHPEYKPPGKYHDIALLETDRSIRLNMFVVPACLDVGAQAAGKALATGWGALANRSNADTLQKVNLYQFSLEECSRLVQPNRHMRAGFDPRTQLCYGDRQQSRDTCGGDSGGPLQVKSNRLSCMYVVVGVTSFGPSNCGAVGQPGVYTRVVQYLPWIESVVWP